MEPNKHRLLLWYRALKSGQYEQTTGALEVVNPETGKAKHCCLGVACRVAADNGLQLNIGEPYPDDTYSYMKFGEGRNECSLPYEVINWLGVISRDPVIGTHEDGRSIFAISANDGLKWTFDQIADSIYEYYQLAEVDSAVSP